MDDRIAPVQRPCAACTKTRFTRPCGVCSARVCGPCTVGHQASHAAEPRPERDRHDGGFQALQNTVRDDGAPEGGDDGSRFFGGGG